MTDTDPELQRIADRIAELGNYHCPECIPILGVVVTADRRRVIVDHAPDCAAFAMWLLGPPREWL